MKKEFYLFLFIFLISFLFLPKIAFAEEINLSNDDIIKLFPSLQSGVMEQWINLTASGEFSEPEKQAAFYLIRNAIQKKQLNYILVDLPKEGLIKLYKLGIFLMGKPDTSTIFTELEKLTVKQVVNIAKEWFLQNQVKVATGTLNYSFKSHNGNQQNATFYYNLVYKPRINNYIDLAIEFYSPENIEPKNSISNVVGLNTWCWDFPDWQKKNEKYIKPFIFKINGRIIHDDQLNSYTWDRTLSSEITFPASVPKIEVAKQPTLLDQIKGDLTKKFVEDVLHIPYSIFTTVQDKIIDFINTIILKQSKPAQKGEIAEVIENAIDQKIITPEKIIDIAQTEIEKSEVPKSQAKQESKSKISLEEAQEILDDITEKIDILIQQAEQLTGVKIITDKKDIIKEEVEKLDRDDEEEEKIEKIEEVQKEEKAPAPSIAICQKIPGYHPVHNSIILNEIAWMGTTTNSNNEWIELKNISNNLVDLTGWQLLDKDQNIKIIFPNNPDRDPSSISAKGFYLLERGNDYAVPDISADLIYTGSLNNSNEALYLFDPSCQLQDEIEIFSNWPFGDNNSKRTIERKGIFEWQTSSNIGGTPKIENSSGYIETPSYVSSGGGSNSPSPSYLKILISEVQISPIAKRFIELYNPNNSTVDLTNWYIQRKTQTGSNFISLVSKTHLNSKTINAYGYFLISRSTSGAVDIVLSDLTLAESNTIQLKNPNGEIADKVGWGQAQDFETSPAQNPQTDQTIGRKWIEGMGYQDIDNNSIDFEIQSPTPKAKNETFRDIIPPETIINSYPLSLTNQVQANFTFSSSEENSTFECKINDENWQACSSLQQYSNLLDGSHTFQVRAKDINQNIDPTPAQYQWAIDSTSPQTEILIHPPSLTNQDQANFTFSSNEGNSTFECKINENEWENCQSPKIYNDLFEGEYTFLVRAKDLNGNLEISPPQYSWQIDIAIENASLSFFSLYTKEKTIEINIANDEGVVAWLLSENEAEKENSDPLWQTEKPSQFTLSEGDDIKTVYLWTKDESENVSSGISAQVILDTTSPSVQFNPLAQIQNLIDFNVSWSGSDTTAGISEYHLKIRKESEEESLDWQNISEEIYQFSGLNGNTYYFKIRVKDNADNLSEWSSETSTKIEKPILEVSPTSLGFETIEFGQTPAGKNLAIGNIGFGDLNWEIITPEVDWLNLNSTSGQTPSNVSVSVNISDLEVGQFSTKIKISSNAGEKEIEVTLNLQEDIIPPEHPQISSPQNDQIFNIENITLTGTAEPNAIILISSSEIKADENGNWQKEIELIEGQNEIEIKAKDEAGNESEAIILNLILDTTPPIANAGLKQSVIINKPITFDASTSSDNIGIISYQWDINVSDGLNWENPDLTGQNPILEIGYSEANNYTVTLRVADAAGNNAINTLTVTVNPLPKILINEIQIAGEGTTHDFIELYNPSQKDIYLGEYASGYFKLVKRTQSGTDDINIKSWRGDLEAKVPAQGYYLWASSEDESFPALIRADVQTKQIISPDNGIGILFINDDESYLIDALGWGVFNNVLFEGNSFSKDPSKNQSLGRKMNVEENYIDTNNNSIDFEVQFPTPKVKNQSLPEDTLPPKISNILVSDITETSVLINWETDEESTSIIEYGIITNYGEIQNSNDYLLSHSLFLNDLDPETIYHYKVESTDTSGNTAWSEDNTFTTLPHQTELLPIFEDNFDSYNLANPVDTSGDLAGQGDWTTTGNNSYEVVDTYADSGTKSIRCKSPSPCYVIKTGTNKTAGRMKIRFYIIPHDTFRYWDTAFYFRQNLEEPILSYVLLKDRGAPFDITVWMGSTDQIYTNITMGQWHTLKVEWNADTDKMRIQLDDLGSSNWIDGNAIDYISTFEISNSVNAGRWIYLDTIE